MFLIHGQGFLYLLVVHHAVQRSAFQPAAQSQLELCALDHQDVAGVCGHDHSVPCTQTKHC